MIKDFNFYPFPILETERLLLRKLKISDDELIYDYQSNKENFLYVDMPIYKNIEEAQEYIAKMNSGVENNKWIIWAIADKNTDTILGTISIWNISLNLQKAEIGYGLFPGNVGNGIMSEALSKIIGYGFLVLGLKKVQAYTSIYNEKSIELLERNHFIKHSTFTESEADTYSGKPTEMFIYEKLNPLHH